MFYIVLEIQVDGNGTKSCLPTSYDTLEAAKAKFFTVCAAAAVSTIPYHAAFILQDNGMLAKSEIFDRRVVEE